MITDILDVLYCPMSIIFWQKYYSEITQQKLHVFLQARVTSCKTESDVYNCLAVNIKQTTDIAFFTQLQNFW